MPNIMQFAMMALKQNPNAQNSPMGKQFMQILQNNDQKAGEELANNLLKTYGKTKEEALEEAKGFFHL